MKRFYKDVSLTEADAGAEGAFAVALDGKPVKTPAKALLCLPNAVLAEAVAGEWRGQGESIEPEQMPLTRLANSVIDQVAKTRAQVVEGTAAYGGRDLLCYRAEEPPDLVSAQAGAWDDYLDWTAERFGVIPLVTSGISPVEQPDALKAALLGAVEEYDNFALAGLNAATALTGSLILPLAMVEGFAVAEDAWQASEVDEAFQANRWGADDEASVRRAANRIAFLDAAKFITLAGA